MNCASAPFVSSAAIMAIVFACIALLAFSPHSARKFSLARRGKIGRYSLYLLVAEPYCHVLHKTIYEHIDYLRGKELRQRFLGRRTGLLIAVARCAPLVVDCFAHFKNRLIDSRRF